MAKLILLKKAEDFANFRHSRAFTGSTLKIRVHRLPNQNAPRFGFIVPKKVLAKAADRNMIKRRLKGILQQSLAQLKPAEVLIFPTNKSLQRKFVDLSAELNQLLKTANLWKP